MSVVRRLLVITREPPSDVLLAVPALRALRHALPKAEIHWLISAESRPAALAVPHADKIIEFGRFSLLKLFRLLIHLRRCRFDAAIDFSTASYFSAFLAWASGAPRRWGYQSPGQRRGRLFSDSQWRCFTRHASDDHLALAGALTPVVFDAALEAPSGEVGRTELERVGLRKRAGAPLVVIDPACGAGRGHLAWPLPNFGVLGHWLLQKYAANIVFASAPGSEKATAGGARLLNGRALDAGAALSWIGLSSLVQQADLVISADSAVMQLAAAHGRPQVALFGPTDPSLVGPHHPRAKIVRSSCAVCPAVRTGRERHGRDGRCMAKISLEQVKDAAAALIDNEGAI